MSKKLNKKIEKLVDTEGLGEVLEAFEALALERHPYYPGWEGFAERFSDMAQDAYDQGTV